MALLWGWTALFWDHHFCTRALKHGINLAFQNLGLPFAGAWTPSELPKNVIDNPMSGWTYDLWELGLKCFPAFVDESHRSSLFSFVFWKREALAKGASL
jgi:hypothetical protein